MKKTFTLVIIICTTLFGTLRAQNTDNIENILAQINADSLLRTVLDLQSFGSRLALREGGNIEVAEYLVQRLNNYGITAEIDSFRKTGDHWLGPIDQWFYNVKGVLPTTDPKDDSLVIVGAHLDAISLNLNYQLLEMAPGADDNASGVAVMLELARICHANNLHFRRDIHFMAYDGEELGLYGSDADAQKRHQAGEKIAIMLNNDMVSFQPDDITPMIPSSAAENEESEYSDSYAYYQWGFRAVFAIEYTFSTSYHTEHDVADSNNYAYHADIARYNMAMLMDYAESASDVSINEHTVASPVKVYPNPVGNTATVQFWLEEDSPVGITVLDMTGRKVLCLPETAHVAGIGHITIDFSPLPAGLYLCQLRTTKGVKTIKVVKQ